MMSHGLVDAQVFSELVQPDGLHLNPEIPSEISGKPMETMGNLYSEERMFS